MKSLFPSVGSVVFFNGFMNTVVGTHGVWVKIKNNKNKIRKKKNIMMRMKMKNQKVTKMRYIVTMRK